MTSRSTVSIIIIGDEILNGETMDTNSHFLCQELHKSGVKVARVSVIPDDVDIIAEEIRLHSQKYTFVLTSGGIGPTHDDVTYEGIAKAFNEELFLHKDLRKIVKSICMTLGLDETAALKMSQVPRSSEIHYMCSPRKLFPLVSVQNVFTFSGIPSYLKHSFTEFKSLFSGNSAEYFSCNLYVDSNEFAIMSILNAAVKEYEGVVKLGSYPNVENLYYQVKLTLEGDSKESVSSAEAFLRSHLPHNTVVSECPPDSEESLLSMQNIFLKKSKNYDDEFSNAVETSLKIIEECFDKYSFQNVCLSFNGGKDCTVLLHLTHIYLAKFYPKRCERLKVIYFRSEQTFPEIEDFIHLCLARYSLQMVTFDAPIKESLKILQKDHPEIQAILLGSRNTDPSCADLKTFQMTDSDWPQYMRINPLISWTYEDVWKFLRTLEVPYCSLYDRGYTSLGCRHNTVPNAQLLASTKDGESYYKPAYLLKDPNQEREGRSVNTA